MAKLYKHKFVLSLKLARKQNKKKRQNLTNVHNDLKEKCSAKLNAIFNQSYT